MAPRPNRESLWQGTLECADAILEDVITLEPIHQLQFFYEWNWRFERCLVPITSAMSQAIGNTLSKMNPFAETVQFANLRVEQGANQSLITAKLKLRIGGHTSRVRCLANARESQDSHKFAEYQGRLTSLQRRSDDLA